MSAALIEIIEDSKLDIEKAYKNALRVAKISKGPVQVFLICRDPLRIIDENQLHILAPGTDIIVYNISESAILNEFEAELESIITKIAHKVSGEIYFNLENESGILDTIVLLKLMENTPERLRCLNDIMNKDKETERQIACTVNNSFPSINERLFLDYVETYNYVAISSLIKQNRVPKSLSNQINHLIRFKNLHFDENSKAELIHYTKKIKTFPELRVYQSTLQEMMELVKPQQIPFIKALYFNCQIEFKQSDFVDFLVRYLRLLEEITIYVLGWDENEAGRLIYCYGPNKGKLAPVRNKELSALRDTFNKTYKLVRKYPQFYRYINDEKVKDLVEKRHLSIAGHGYQGVSSGVLEQVYGEDILLDLYKAIESIGIELKHNYYDVLNAFLVAEYYRLTEDME